MICSTCVKEMYAYFKHHNRIKVYQLLIRRDLFQKLVKDETIKRNNLIECVNNLKENNFNIAQRVRFRAPLPGRSML
ncbi:hypothetical protein O9G_004368 [Rozella allomycis CSF55]|uniref:Uncharacterized protein n=1 Tax=Rozella allomycis (strain CSF55) TaxID=988480 RepID=A0A075B3S4_ROZAC|nr:hypothetical protein O9G_004368 [Rozella allomycis CSF55]|eukprot:EPZ35711.1 hypothetical protein O9G_004368 [Rozella allomycis CSF55]